jgi:hypothetical protein
VSDEPRKVLVGTFPSGLGSVHAFQDIGGPLIADAAAKLDAERMERERAVRAVITVSRPWLLNLLRDAIAVAERDLARAIELDDYGARLIAARKVNRLRADFTFCDVKAPTP